jgi:hypothetical protein
LEWEEEVILEWEEKGGDAIAVSSKMQWYDSNADNTDNKMPRHLSYILLSPFLPFLGICLTAKFATSAFARHCE